MFSCTMTVFNQSFWSSQLNSQWPSRCFHLRVPQTGGWGSSPNTSGLNPSILNIHLLATFLTSANSNPTQSGSQFIFYTIPLLYHISNLPWSPFSSILLISFDPLSFHLIPQDSSFILSIITVDLEYYLSLIKTLQHFLRAFRNHWCYDSWLTILMSARAY